MYSAGRNEAAPTESAAVAGTLTFRGISRTPASVLVVSHERSGTHFLMNSIARGYGYTSTPWVDMDYDSMPINFFHPPAIAGALAPWRTDESPRSSSRTIPLTSSTAS